MSSAQPKIKLIETDTTDKNKEILVSGGGLYIRNLNDDGQTIYLQPWTKFHIFHM